MEALTAFSEENRDLFIFGMPTEEEPVSYTHLGPD